MVGPTVIDMSNERGRHLRVVRDEEQRSPRPEAPARTDYWSQVQALRAEQRRLRAG